MSLYTDPSNKRDLMNRVKNIYSIPEVISLVTNIFPTWIVHYSPEYAADYPHLTNNWKDICKMCGTTKKQIILVDELTIDKHHMFISFVTECLTRAGFSVRSVKEFNKCQICDSVIPTVKYWEKMKESNISNIPTVYTNHCKKCI